MKIDIDESNEGTFILANSFLLLIYFTQQQQHLQMTYSLAPINRIISQQQQPNGKYVVSTNRIRIKAKTDREITFWVETRE